MTSCYGAFAWLSEGFASTVYKRTERTCHWKRALDRVLTKSSRRLVRAAWMRCMLPPVFYNDAVRFFRLGKK